MIYTAKEVLTLTVGFYLLGLSWAVDGWLLVFVVLAGAVLVNIYPVIRWTETHKYKRQINERLRELNLRDAKLHHPAGKGL